jgi:hypothetical protein
MAQFGQNMLPSGCFLEVFIDVLDECIYFILMCTELYVHQHRCQKLISWAANPNEQTQALHTFLKALSMGLDPPARFKYGTFLFFSFYSR